MQVLSPVPCGPAKYEQGAPLCRNCRELSPLDPNREVLHLIDEILQAGPPLEVTVLLVGCDPDEATVALWNSKAEGLHLKPTFRRIYPATPEEHLRLHLEAGKPSRVYTIVQGNGQRRFYKATRLQGDQGQAIMKVIIPEIWKLQRLDQAR